MQETFKSWAVEDRPVEKVMLKGQAACSNSELLSIVVNGINLDAASTLMQHVGHDLRKLAAMSVREIANLKVPGIGQQKAVAIAAAFELGQRRQEQQTYTETVHQSHDIAQFLRAKFQFSPHEVFCVMYLNRANKIKHYEVVSEGGITGTVADPRIILKKALENNATSIILCHNHPSGSLRPSRQDEELTTKIKTAASYLDVQVLDHVIVSDEGYFSFADEGLM